MASTARPSVEPVLTPPTEATGRALDALRFSAVMLDPSEREYARGFLGGNATNLDLEESVRVMLARVADVLAAIERDRREANTRAAQAVIRQECGGREVFTPLERRGLLAELPVRSDGCLDAESFRRQVATEVRARSAGSR